MGTAFKQFALCAQPAGTGDTSQDLRDAHAKAATSSESEPCLVPRPFREYVRGATFIVTGSTIVHGRVGVSLHTCV